MALKEVKIELTGKCDKGCVHCSSNADFLDYQELSLDTVKRIIDEAIELGAESFVLTGGEATKYMDLIFVVNYLSQKGIKNIKLYTMATPDETTVDYLKQLHEIGLSEIVYSLNFALVETFPGKKDDISSILREVLNKKCVNFTNVPPFLAKISSFMPVSLHYCLTTLTKEDLNKIDGVIRELNPSNFKTLSFLCYVPHGRGDSSLTLSSQELRELKTTLIEFVKKYPNKVKFGSPFNILDITYTPCKAGDSTLTIGSDGSVYPCDAMKYFDYLGSGGNIYSNSLREIYDSPYFTKVRLASKEISENCQNCGNTNCHGGCLAQKMIETISINESITPTWYQENALRTINDFGSLANLKFNAYTGVFGEAGEFFDYMKKYYTHSLDEDKKAEIKNLASKELGDIMWYLSTSLALYFGYSLSEIFNLITSKKCERYVVDENIISKAALKQDPLCPYQEKHEYPVDIIDNYIPELDEEKDVYQVLYDFKKALNKLDYIDETNPEKSCEEAIRVVANIVIYIAFLAHHMFGKNLSELLVDNIEKLKKRYPNGFDEEVANARIAANKRYKEEERMKVKNLIPKEESK